MQIEQPIAVTLLTGFLGAGKTTLINRILRNPALSDTAVIVNEFGDVAIDHLLVEKADDGVVELGGGCLCCAVRGELADTLTMLLQRGRPPRRAIVETSGLADPVPILQMLAGHPILASSCRLAGIITVVDMVNGAASLDAFEVARSQVAVADRIICTKMEMAAGSGDLPARLRTLNPRAELLDGREAAAATLLDDGLTAFRGTLAMGCAHDDNHNHSTHHHTEFSSVSLTHDQAIPQEAIEGFLDLLATQQGEEILRIKGIVATAEQPDQPLIVHGAQRLLHAPERLAHWPEGAARQTRLVVIGHGLDTDYIHQIFAAFTSRPAVDTPDRTALENNPLAIGGFRF
ncbi:GTP-binding protein [Chelativorans sp. Marseille-P2723]|uniref:CobW family GTP-binding protein n=1 Tax=Chelativorans sp. Marseille-P2723 TaxID=2709133 RepID=UPI001570753B|nr:GTP-binding protein [Chelativorans sp. Marseille-P2723]